MATTKISELNPLASGSTCAAAVLPIVNDGVTDKISIDNLRGTLRGASNTVSGQETSTIGGGVENTISSDSSCSTISGGYCNSINGAEAATISGGYENCISGGSCSFIMGGKNNLLTHNCSAIAGTDITSRATSSLHVNNILLETGSIPTADPGIPGMLFIAGGALKVSGCIA